MSAPDSNPKPVERPRPAPPKPSCGVDGCGCGDILNHGIGELGVDWRGRPDW